MTRTTRTIVALLALGYVSLAILANWLASAYVIQVPLTHLYAPAGIFAIGAVLVLRDWMQQLAGFWTVYALVLAAAVASYLAGEAFGWTQLQKIALASVLAFTVSETIEAVVFTPLRHRSLTFGVLASGFVGNAVDSWIFLTVAFGSLAYFWGQFVGKGEMILLGVVLTALRRRIVPAPALDPA